MSVFASVLAKLATDAAAATELAELAKAQGVAVIISSKLIAELETMAGTTGKDGKAREGAMEAVTALCGSSKLIEPLLVKLLPVILDKAGDKVRVAPCAHPPGEARRAPTARSKRCVTRVRRPCAGP